MRRVVRHCAVSAGLCIIPKPENDFRPLALRHRPLAFVSALLIAAKVLALGVVAVTPTTAELSTITAARIVQLTNAERKKTGLAELKTNDALTRAAQLKAEHMLKEDYFAHISPSGVTPWFWINKMGYTYQIAGENLAIDFTEAEEVVAAWIASPTHKENMLLPAYAETGVAVATGEFQGGTSTVVVHMFGLPSVAAATSQAPAKAVAPPAPTPATPLSTPLPSAAPALRTPRIALAPGIETVGISARLAVEGELGTTVHILVNGQERLQTPVTSDRQFVEVALTQVPDGTVILRAQASGEGGRQSAVTEPVVALKDTSGPTLAEAGAAFVLAPGADRALALLKLPEDTDAVTVTQQEDNWTFGPTSTIVVPVKGELSIELADSRGNSGQPYAHSLSPSFAREGETGYVAPPAQLSKTTRWLMAVAAAIIALLLLVAIFVRISIQRPALITHASAVIILAVFLLFW